MQKKVYVWDTKWLTDIGVPLESAELLISRGAKDGKYLAGFLKMIGLPKEVYELALHEIPGDSS